MACEDPETERRLYRLETAAEVLKVKVDDIKSTQEATGQLPTVVAKWEGIIESLTEDLHFLRERVEKRDEERKKEREEAAREHKEEQKRRREEKRADRRWIIATILASAGLIIGAIEFFISNHP